MANFSTNVSCKKCGRTAILKVTCVQPNSSGGGAATCNSCYATTSYSYVLTEGSFTYIR